MREKDKICPFCHSTNIEKERPFEEIKKELLENIKEIGQMEGVDLKLDENQLNYNPYDDERYLKRLEEHGLELTCKDCGTTFYENDEVNINDKVPTPITSQEYFEIIFSNLPDLFGNDNEFAELQKKMFIEMETKSVKVYYKEKALEKVAAFNRAKERLNEVVESNTTSELPS